MANNTTLGQQVADLEEYENHARGKFSGYKTNSMPMVMQNAIKENEKLLLKLDGMQRIARGELATVEEF